MNSTMNGLWNHVKRFHANTAGADVPIGAMLLIGLIVLPLVALLILFKDELVKIVQDEGKDVLSKGEKNTASGMTFK